ncbi:MAG TPA: pro-sigmaK processing inhibitor BofA family protein [Oscillospiraceae bacterium]|nr:pro-sigmaK processing inhibitor BofA family protein [Oscillospiraceae bacterium]
MGTAFIIICVLLGLIMLAYYGRSKRPVRSALFGMLSGAATLFLVGFVGSWFGLVLPVNVFTTFVALIFGVPGVAMLVASILL